MIMRTPQDIIKLFEKIVYDIRSRVTCSYDLVRGVDRRHEVYPSITFQEVSTLEFIQHNERANKIRAAATAVQNKLHAAEKIRYKTAALLAITEFGVGECDECSMTFIFQYALLNLSQGYLLNFALENALNTQLTHRFSIYVPSNFPEAFSPIKPFEHTSFLHWFNQIPQSWRDQMILVDVWRNLVAPLTENAAKELVACIQSTGIDRIIVAAEVHKSPLPVVAREQYKQDIALIYQEICKDPAVADLYMGRREIQSENTHLVTLLNAHTGLAFFTAVRPGFVTDAVLELNAENIGQAAKLKEQFPFARTIKTSGPRYFVLEGINSTERGSLIQAKCAL